MDSFDYVVQEPPTNSLRKTNYDRFVAKLIKEHPDTWVKFSKPFPTRNASSSPRQAFKKRGCLTQVVEFDDNFFLYLRFETKPGHYDDKVICEPCADRRHDLCSRAIGKPRRCCCPDHYLMPPESVAAGDSDE